MRISIVTKTILLFAICLAMFAGVSYFGNLRMDNTTKALYRINEGYLPLTSMAAQIETAQKNHQSAVSRVREAEDARVRRVLIKMLGTHYPKVARQNIVQGIAHCDKMLLVTSDKRERSFFEKSKEHLLAIRKKQELYSEEVDKLLALSDEDENEQKIQNIEAHLRGVERNLMRAIKVLMLYLDDEISRNILWVEGQSDRAQWAYILLTLSALLIGIALTTISAFQLKPLRRLTEAAVKIAHGEYDGRIGIKSGDELGRLAEEFDKMRTSLAERDRVLVSQRDELANKAADLNNLKLHYENIIKNLWSCVLVTDTKGRLTTVNPRARKLWGDTLDKHLGHPVGELPLGNNTLADKLDFERVLKDKLPFSRHAISMNDTDGEERRISFTAVPFLENEQLRGMLILGEDVTEELDMKERLNMAERMAAIGQMAARITHEIRNPLSSISLNTEMLSEEISSPEMNREESASLITSIISQIERLRDITDEYLKYARMPKPEKQYTELNRSLEELIHFLEPEFTQMGISCEFKPKREKLFTELDKNLITQAFLNLLKNAKEVSKPGQKIEVWTENTEDTIKIGVADSGPGIPKEIQERIFEVFFSTKEGGSGLGLAIAKQIVVEHGGDLTFHNRPEGGTEFLIHLPLL